MRSGVEDPNRRMRDFDCPLLGSLPVLKCKSFSLSYCPSYRRVSGCRPNRGKERVNAIALAPVEEFRRDSDLFAEGVRHPEAQKRNEAAIKRGFQTREAEMSLGRLLGDLADTDR
jgi:hypothetical protein